MSRSVSATRRPLGRMMALAYVLGLGVGLGLLATYVALRTNLSFGQVEAGPWLAWPRTGALDADPYTRASLARNGEVPLGLGEGLVFTARRDSGGRPLVGNCAYRVIGRAPQARFWTLTLQTPSGALVDNPAGRHGFTSSEVVRSLNGQFAIEVSSEARPGNWLPAPPSGRFDLVLRLYDTPVSATSSNIDPATVPRIEQGACP